MKNSVKDKVKEVKQTIKNNWNSAVEFLKNIDLMQVGKDIIQGLIDGIGDRKSTRLNSSQVARSYAIFWLKKNISRVFCIFMGGVESVIDLYTMCCEEMDL